MSAGVPAGPTGTIGATTSTPGKSPAASAARAMGVSTKLGVMALAVIPRRANSPPGGLVWGVAPPLHSPQAGLLGGPGRGRPDAHADMWSAAARRPSPD